MSKRQSSQTSDSSYFTRLGMEVELQRLEERASQLRAWLGRLPARVKAKVQGLTGGSADGIAATPGARGRKRRRKMSAEARKRISDAQKARWAKQKGEAPSTHAAPAEATAVVAKAKRGSRRVRKGGSERGRRKMSAAARKRISAAQKAHWAKRKRATS